MALKPMRATSAGSGDPAAATLQLPDFLSGKNLTDTEYYAASNTVMPQPPRHALLSGTYTF